MARTINFVSERRKKLTKAQEQDRKILKIVVNILIGLFVIFLIVLAGRFYFLFQVRDIKDTQQNLRTRILSNEQVELEYVLFAQKLKQLSVFFGRRKDKQEALTFFSEVFGDDVIVSGIDYSSAEEDVVAFTIKAPSIFVMERVFDTLESSDVSTVYPSIQKSSMRRSATGNYTVDLEVVLTQESISQDNTGTSTAPLDQAIPAAPELDTEI